MNIIPKSEAELVSQFMGIPPIEIEMGPINNRRYEDAYAEIDARLGDTDPNTGSALRDIAETNADIVSTASPFSYLTVLRKNRKIAERYFQGKLDGAVRNAEAVDSSVIYARIEELENNTLDLSKASDIEAAKVDNLFPSGNYFLHATEIDAILAILHEGVIKATIGFDQEERMERTHGGSFGVSGNYNNVANILGTQGHLAGFVADPETVLQNQGGYFAPSSKSCWDELQYFPANEDPLHIMRIRDAETHIETVGAAYQQASMFHAVLSGNPDALASIPPHGVFQMQHDFSSSMDLQSANPSLLSRAYRKAPNGDFRFTEMLGHDGENISSLSVVVGAALEGAFGLEAAESLQRHGAKKMDISLIDLLEPVFGRLSEQTDTLYQAVASEVGSAGAIKVENTLFYCPEKDYKKWVDVLARMPHQPRGIVTYDGREVRTPAAFALALPDNGGPSLSNQLSLIKDGGTIDWTQIFDEAPVAVPHNHFLIKPREANLAGVLLLDESGALAVMSLDDLDEDKD